ncbi:hypothetical protein EON63_03005 [archaeon]|nr:MAG: hypothetical protein EON63_03005 [archaeon]
MSMIGIHVRHTHIFNFTHIFLLIIHQHSHTKQESQFNGNPLNSPKRADNTPIFFDNPTASLTDEEAQETLGRKLRVCEAILRRKTLTEMEEETKKARELEGVDG